MAFTYDDGLDSDKDKVRFYTGDVDKDTHVLSDATIDALVELEGGHQKATIAAIEHLLIKINREPDMTAAFLKLAWGGSREGLEAQLVRLQRKWDAGYKRRGSRKSAKRHDMKRTSADGLLD